MSDIHEPETAPQSADHTGLLATLGLAGAFMASACCIVPLVLVTLGISGAWIGNCRVALKGEMTNPTKSMVMLCR